MTTVPELAAPAIAERGYYSVSDAAALLGVSRVTIWRWIRAGRLSASRLGHRTIRIQREDLDRIVREVTPEDSQLRIVRGRGTDTQTEGRQASPARLRDQSKSQHVAQFYETDAFLLDAVRDFLGPALDDGDAAIVIATQAHRDGLEERFLADGLDVAGAHASGRYISLDAAETLSRFTVDGRLDTDRFTEVVGSIIARATGDGRGVRIFGEMVALLAVGGNHAAAIRLEQLWNRLGRALGFSLLCGYPMDRLGGEALGALVGDVCTEHSQVIPAESYAELADPGDRLRAIAVLQQKARSLEAEIAERRRAEQALQSLFRVSQKLHANLELEALLDQLVEEAMQLVGAEGGCAGLRTPEGMVSQKYFKNADMFSLEYCWPPGHGLAGWVLEHKVPYVTNDALGDEQVVRELCEQFGVLSALCTPILDGRGEILGFFELHNRADGSGFTDADEEKLMAVSRVASIAIQNARLYQEAQNAVSLRDEFLSIAAHELRTPLTSLTGGSQLALRRIERGEHPESERIKQTLRMITGQADKLSRLVTQLLDISRLEAGQLTLERHPTDLSILVEQVVAGAGTWSDRHVISMEAPLSLEADVDPLRLEQVLTNLLDNALKYSPDGGAIEVVLSRSSRAAVELSVRDHGLGIPPENRDQIFERFYQAHTISHRSGIGLGLYISRQIVDLHGGEIKAEFPPDGGTHIVVTLPSGG